MISNQQTNKMICFLKLDNPIRDRKWTGMLYLTSGDHEYGISTKIFTSSDWISPWGFRVKNDSIGCYAASDPASDVFLSPDNGLMNFGDGVIFPGGKSKNSLLCFKQHGFQNH